MGHVHGIGSLSYKRKRRRNCILHVDTVPVFSELSFAYALFLIWLFCYYSLAINANQPKEWIRYNIDVVLSERNGAGPLNLCESGGIGRRAGLRIQWPRL